VSTVVLYILSKVCQYLTLYILSNICQYFPLCRLLDLCHYINLCLVHSGHFLSVPYTVPYVGSTSLCALFSCIFCTMSVIILHFTVCFSVSVCPMLSFTFYPPSVSTPLCTVFSFCGTVYTDFYCSLSTVCQ